MQYLRTTWRTDLSWFSVGDEAISHACNRMRQDGKCDCRRSYRKSIYNPCQRAHRIQENATALGLGEDIPHTDLTLDKMVKWFFGKMCKTAREGQTCNHKACDKLAHVYNWLLETQAKRAA